MVPEISLAYLGKLSGTNAYVVKPMSYDGFIEALREVGLFWGSLNQLPSGTDQDR
jgi:hypothetical protein